MRSCSSSDEQQLLSAVWLVRELCQHSLDRIKSTLDLDKRERMIAGPDINLIWSNRLNPRDQLRIEDAFQTQKQREDKGCTTEMFVDDIAFKRHMRRADLTDSSRPMLVSLFRGSMVFDNELKRVTRFSSKVKSVRMEDDKLVGTLERPYTQPWPVWERKRGLARVRRRIPSLSSDDFPFAPVPFRTERVSEMRSGDFVSYTLTPNASGILHATDIRVEYEARVLRHTELSRILSWDRGDLPAFVPERFFTVAWQIRVMFETDRMLKSRCGIFSDSDQRLLHAFAKTARFRWKSMKPGFNSSVEWIYKRNLAEGKRADEMYPWLLSTDGMHRDSVVDFTEMQSFKHSGVDGNRMNVCCLRRVDRFESKVARVETVDGVSVAWLQRSTEQPEFYDLEFEHLPLVIGTDNTALSGLKAGEWLRYGVHYIRGETPLDGCRFYAHSAEQIKKPAEMDTFEWMGELTAIHKIDFEKRTALAKLTRDLQKCTSVLEMSATSALSVGRSQLDAMISNVSALIQVCDECIAKEPFEVKHLCDWDENDVLEWMSSIENGIFGMHRFQLRRGIEVRRLVGVNIDMLLDDALLEKTFYYMRDGERSLLKSHIKKLLQKHFG